MTVSILLQAQPPVSNRQFVVINGLAVSVVSIIGIELVSDSVRADGVMGIFVMRKQAEQTLWFGMKPEFAGYGLIGTFCAGLTAALAAGVKEIANRRRR